MPQQVAVTIVAPVRPARLDDLRQLLDRMGDDIAGNDVVPFGRLSDVHFARLVVLDATTDVDGRAIAPKLVYLSDVDGSLARHVEDLVDVAGAGIDELFGHCEGYPEAGATRRQRLACLYAAIRRRRGRQEHRHWLSPLRKGRSGTCRQACSVRSSTPDACAISATLQLRSSTSHSRNTKSRSPAHSPTHRSLAGSLKKLAAAEEQRARALRATEEAVRLANLRDQSGFSAYFEVLDAMQQLYVAENNLARTRRDRLVAFVQSYRALEAAGVDRALAVSG